MRIHPPITSIHAIYVSLSAAFLQLDAGRAVPALYQALKISPGNVEALVNLGTHHQEQGDVEIAAGLFGRAYSHRPNMHGLLVRSATLLRPVPDSLAQMRAGRARYTVNCYTVNCFPVSLFPCFPICFVLFLLFLVFFSSTRTAT